MDGGVVLVMMRVELYKLIKSKCLLYALLAQLAVSLAYLLMIYQSITNEGQLSLSQSFIDHLALEYHREISYYFMPFLIIYLLDAFIYQEIQAGQIKHLILRSTNLRVYLSKLISLSLAICLGLALQRFISFTCLPNLLGYAGVNSQPKQGQLFLVYVLALILMTSLSLLTKENHLLLLMLLHLTFLGLSELVGEVGQYLYVGQLKAVLNLEPIKASHLLVEFIGFSLITIGLIHRREHAE